MHSLAYTSLFAYYCMEATGLRDMNLSEVMSGCTSQELVFPITPSPSMKKCIWHQLFRFQLSKPYIIFRQFTFIFCPEDGENFGLGIIPKFCFKFNPLQSGVAFLYLLKASKNKATGVIEKQRRAVMG